MLMVGLGEDDSLVQGDMPPSREWEEPGLKTNLS